MYSTYLWTEQNITVTWAIYTQTATGFAHSWLFSIDCYSLMFTLHFCLTKEKSETLKIMGEKEYLTLQGF